VQLHETVNDFDSVDILSHDQLRTRAVFVDTELVGIELHYITQIRHWATRCVKEELKLK
jgi:hypothetical protein